MIELITVENGKKRTRYAKAGVTADEICYIAEAEVYGGYAEYSAVVVDGEIYAEYEE